MKVRLVDCVGYIVEGASGVDDESEQRMVKTPWSDKEIPFSEAAKIGTERVIRDHSTVGVVVTCDGSFGELPAQGNYRAAKIRKTLCGSGKFPKTIRR